MAYQLERKNTQFTVNKIGKPSVSATPCSRNFQNVKLRSTKKNLFANQFRVKTILAKFDYQKLPFLQFQRLVLSTLKFGKFGT